MKSLLLEIGTEEIPAGYITTALEMLSQNIVSRFKNARIEHGQIWTGATPRRLVVMIDKVAEHQNAIIEDILGPPERIAIDAQGEYTIPAIKFAEKVGVDITSLKIIETEKGRYLAVRISNKGLHTKHVLKTILPEVILQTPFPKTMRWSDLSIAFARPIKSVLALFGSEVVSFLLADRIKSGRYTYGHTFMRPEKIKIEAAQDYIKTLRKAKVIVDLAERKELVLREIDSAAQKLGGKILRDDQLVDTVVNLVEVPIASGGEFEEEFLELPPEILITAMKKHQKYFAVINRKNNLKPCFVAVNNTRAKKMSVVVKGHQRVLRARLSDAQFFFRADLEMKMDQWRDKLEGILFQTKLGSMKEKTQRIEKLVNYIAESVSPELREQTIRAAQLCKTDLVSQVVYEFPSLQGIMGRVYALKAGESQEVAYAIEDHYRPTFSGGPLPRNRIGAILAVADKIDSIVGCFSVGLIPTGASDPYALRRQGIGIIQILQQQNIQLNLKDIINKALTHYAHTGIRETSTAVLDFFQNRIAQLMTEEGINKDIVAAVVNASIDNIPYVWKRARALLSLKNNTVFEPLAAAFKRIVNILRRTEAVAPEQMNPQLFVESAESNLYQAYLEATSLVAQQIETGEFEAALQTISALGNPVDRFFEDVMVMTEDGVLRRNRLSLLTRIASLFGQIADFSKLSVQ
jgi:glycyl-tRNA synthetase beta chain